MDSSTSTTPSAPSPVNWEVAASTAAALCAAGPRFTQRQAQREADGLRRAAEESVDHVHRLTGLEAARDLRDSDVLVVDRPTWVRANTQAFATLLAPAFEHVRASRPAEYEKAVGGAATAATGVEAGAVLAFLASKVLGQYEPFCALPGPDGAAPGPAGGRLLLVAPNIAEVRVELNVDPEDFRLWVCLHEQTHRVQFAAAPWLRQHLQDNILELVSGLFDKADTLPERLVARFRALLQGSDEASDTDAGPSAGSSTGSDTGAGAGGQTVGRPRTGIGARDGGGSGPGQLESTSDSGLESASQPPSMGLLEFFQDAEDKERLANLTAVMSVLEGHANVIMDAIDSSVVPTVKTIRQRFDRRSATRSSLDRWIRRVMGMDAKMRQYRDGQRFVQHAVQELGMDGFNVVWDGPENLPTARELHQPAEWIQRVRDLR